MMRSVSKGLAGLVVSIGLLASASAFALGLDPAFPEPALGSRKGQGGGRLEPRPVDHDRGSKSPSPAYLQALRDDGWDVMRFDRLSRGDTLTDSTRRLVDYTASLKKKRLQAGRARRTVVRRVSVADGGGCLAAGRCGGRDGTGRLRQLRRVL